MEVSWGPLVGGGPPVENYRVNESFCVLSTKTLKSLRRPWNNNSFNSASYYEQLIQSCVTTWVNTNIVYSTCVFYILFTYKDTHSLKILKLKYNICAVTQLTFLSVSISLSDSQDSGSLCFCFRWLLIWFKREFSFEDILSLWEVREVRFVNHNTSSRFHIYSHCTRFKDSPTMFLRCFGHVCPVKTFTYLWPAPFLNHKDES